MLSLIVPTYHPDKYRLPPGDYELILTMDQDPEHPEEIRRTGVVPTMRRGAEAANGDILAFLHDDVAILENDWVGQVERMFDNPKVGLVGFGGALGFGNKEIYKLAYHYQQLARHYFFSNMMEWEAHGYRATRKMRIAALDGFSLIFRRQAYEDMGGWQEATYLGLPQHHMYDAWASCMMARHGWETWLVPVRCDHHGGVTATTPEYLDSIKRWGWKDENEMYHAAHRIVYEEFRDVLPIRVEI